MSGTVLSRAAGVLAAAAALLAPGAAAQADSIVFVRAGDVWLTTPDASREHRVTASGGFTAVTQADDGTIVAVKDGALHRIDRTGAALNAPFRVQAYAAYGARADTTPLDPDLAPDGTKVAFWVMTTCAYPGSGMSACVRTQITDAAKPTDALTPYDTQTGWKPTWMSNDRMIYSNQGAFINTIGFGPGNWDKWFQVGEDLTTADSAITRANDKVAAVGGRSLQPPWSVRFYATNGAPPAAPTERCTRDHGADAPEHLTWAPDGSGLAYHDSGGVRILAGLNIDACTAAQPITIADARSPDWGPADVPAAAGTGSPAPTPAAPRGTPAAPPTATLVAKLVTGQRLRTVRRSGLRLRVTCPARCTVVGTARVKRTTIAKGRAVLASGKGTIALKATRRGRAMLRRARRLKVTVVLTTTVAGKKATRTVTVTLKR